MDLEKDAVTVVRRDGQIVIPAAAVMGLQMLRGPPGEGEFQLNIKDDQKIFRDAIQVSGFASGRQAQ